jgi:gluconate:H+ symporter, GntP family
MSPVAPWSAHDTQLLFSVSLGLAIIIGLISGFKIVPFFSILIGTFVTGLVAGVPADKLGFNFTQGAGQLLGDAGIIIALGAMLGALLAESGAADQIVSRLLRHVRGAILPWVMAAVALVIGLPLFFEVGLVLLAPIIFVVARRSGRQILTVAIPALAGLTALHALLPPHPGPLIAVRALHADLGVTMCLGLIIAIPAVILGGPLYGQWLGARMPISQPERIGQLFDVKQPMKRQPGFIPSLFVMLLPVVLILGETLAKLALPSSSALFQVISFIGEPVVALSITVAVAIVVLAWSNGLSLEKVAEILRMSLGAIAVLLLTIGAGGGLKQTLIAAGISDTITKIGVMTHLSLVLLAWVTSVALRQATGSATVATATTAGILAPLVTEISVVHHSLIALSIGAGSVFFCHVNDAGFWMVREYFDLNLVQTIKVWSVLQTIVSIIGLMMVLLLWNLFP